MDGNQCVSRMYSMFPILPVYIHILFNVDSFDAIPDGDLVIEFEARMMVTFHDSDRRSTRGCQGIWLTDIETSPGSRHIRS